MYSPAIQKLIDLFCKFPTVGPRTATRFVFYLLQLPKSETDELVRSINLLKALIRPCPFCQNFYEQDGSLCPLCSDRSRSNSTLCIVEKETDLESIEKTRKYKGRYFVLGGTVSRLHKEEMNKLKIAELQERIANPSKFGLDDAKLEEIILAFNPTTEGEATMLYLERLLKPLPVKISRLAVGLPIGAELEYADEETLSSALIARKTQ